jgi:hypothetical protein
MHTFVKWTGHIPYMGKKGGAYRVLVGKPEERRSFVGSRRSWENNIKMDLREVG